MRLGISGLGLTQRILGINVSAELAALRTAMEGADTFVITGDSTRSRFFNDAVPYTADILGKAGINVVGNATGGMSASEWAAGTVLVSRADAIAAIPGTGSTSVLEFSLGINDVQEPGLDTAAALFTSFKTAIDPLLASKPDLTIVFSQPVPARVETKTWNAELNEAYDLLGAEYSSHVVQIYDAMLPVYDPTTTQEFYADLVHPNFEGTRRVMNIMLNDVVPDSLLSIVTLDDQHYSGDIVRGNDNVNYIDGAGVVNGSFWDATTGSVVTDASWARFIAADISTLTPRTQFYIQHNGNRTDVLYLPAVDTAPVSTQLTPAISLAAGARVYNMPDAASTATVLAANISDAGAVGDPIAFQRVKAVEGGFKGTFDKTQAEINTGLTLRLSDETVDPILPADNGDPLPSVTPVCWLDFTARSTLFRGNSLDQAVWANYHKVRAVSDRSGNGNHAYSYNAIEDHMRWDRSGNRVSVRPGKNALEIDVTSLTGQHEIFWAMQTQDDRFMLASSGTNFLGAVHDGNTAGVASGFGSVTFSVDGVDFSGTRDDLHTLVSTGNSVVIGARGCDLTGKSILRLFNFNNFGTWDTTAEVYAVVITETLTTGDRATIVSHLQGQMP